MSAGVESLQLRLEATFDGPIDTHHRNPEGEIVIWRRLHHLGSGAFGTVWKEQRVGSETERHDAVRAVKQSPKRHRRAWKRELQAMCRFSQHTEHFVHCLGWFESTDYLYIAMEFVPHGTLQAHIVRRPLPEHETVLVMTQLAQAVAYMHKANFLHRDLKPLNVLVNHPGPDWHVKVADFGTSNELWLGGKSTIDPMGTMGFVAPEVLLAESGKYTSAVDIWSLGAIAYCLLTKKPPFPNYADIVKYAKQGGEFPIQALRKRRCSFFCEEFTQRLMKIDRTERPTIDQVMADTWLAPHSDEDDTASDEDWQASKRWTDTWVSPNQQVHTVAQSSSVAPIRVEENSLRALSPRTIAPIDAMTVAINTGVTQHDTIHEYLKTQLVSSQDFDEVARDAPQFAKGASSISPKGFETFDYDTPKLMLSSPRQDSNETGGGPITFQPRRELPENWDQDLFIDEENLHEPLVEISPLAESASMSKSEHGDTQENQREALVQNLAPAQSTPVAKFEHEDGSANAAQAVQKRAMIRRDVSISSKHSERSTYASPPGTQDSDQDTDPMVDSISRADLLTVGPLETQPSSLKQNQEDSNTVFLASSQGGLVGSGYITDREELPAGFFAPRRTILPVGTMPRKPIRNPLTDQAFKNDVKHREGITWSAREQIMKKRLEESTRLAPSRTSQADAEQQALDKVTSSARPKPDFKKEAMPYGLLKEAQPAMKWLATADRNYGMPEVRGHRISPNRPQRRQVDASESIINLDYSEDKSQARRIRSQMSDSYNGPSQLDAKKRQIDRDNLFAAAEKNVSAYMQAIDQKVFTDTGNPPLALMKLWEQRAKEAFELEVAQRRTTAGKSYQQKGSDTELADTGNLFPTNREQRTQHVKKPVKSAVTDRNTTTGRSYQQKGSDTELAERPDIDYRHHAESIRAQMPQSRTRPLKSESAHVASTSMQMVVPENGTPSGPRRGQLQSTDDDAASEMSGSESPSSYTKGGLGMTDGYDDSSSGIDEETFPGISRERSRRRRERGLRPTDENGVIPQDGSTREGLDVTNPPNQRIDSKEVSMPPQRIDPRARSPPERKAGLFTRMKRTMKNL